MGGPSFHPSNFPTIQSTSAQRLAFLYSLWTIIPGDEFTHVLSYPRIAERLSLKEEEVDVILTALLSQALITLGNLELHGVTRDSNDDPVVACAVEGGANYIVSGDHDQLTLESYEGVRVVTPHQFVSLLSA